MEIKVYRNWNIKKAKDLYTYCSGISKGAKYFGTGFPYLTFTEIFHNYFVPDTLTNFVQSNDRERKNCSIKRGDVFLTRTSETDNELGMSCVALKDYPNATFNGFSKRLRPINNEILPEYAGFYFRSPIFRAAVTSMSSIITRASLNEKMLDRLPVVLPPLSVQQKIANILSRYDEAIENNSKRIKLLEQMAQNLYKEWFVRFRFPGYEKCEFENGMPKGWCYKKLFDVVNVTYGYAFASELFCDDETLNPVVRIRDILDNQTNTFTSETCADKYIIKENEILIGMDGIFHMCMWNGEKAYQNQRVVKLTSKTNEISNYFLFLAVQPQVKFLEQTIAGTTVAHLGDKHLKRMSILLPSESVLNDATKIFDSLMKQKNQLFKLNQNLANQRDLLLPRLMSGKLEV